ncbi:sugar phosphate isomerase/epimerase [Jiulongibacter sediminis]|jgi:sugar phosphate isomerase/epimerase|uniref:sugar phosphate isomerase/epimerase family protein n=1 Tax=Jiulongibacter sediminis TaxID=1605367 RepID=UPI0026ECF623|nr:sugar phosphate isomerase/epimerase family protein [Jiulongibacter sediminis]
MQKLKLLSLAIGIGLFIGCNTSAEQSSSETTEIPEAKYSLAQWSFNRDLFAGDMSTIDFVYAAGEMGFDGVEYVNQFFIDKAEDFEFLDSLNAAAEEAGVKNLMIQLDRTGNLCASDETERNKAVETAMKWIDAAKYINAPAVRVNAHGDGSAEEMKTQCMDGIGKLAEYANTQGVQVLIENHGGVSSRGDWLADLVGSLSDKEVGSLADFHNWCYETVDGGLWGECLNEYDYYKGFAELIPSAKGVSVKAMHFDSTGNEPNLNFPKFFTIMKEGGYDGFLGVEYEGNDLPSREGILKTKELAAKTWEAVYSAK